MNPLVSNVSVKLFTIISILKVTSILSVNYYCVLTNENIFSACPGEEKYYIGNSIDFSKLEHEFIADDTITVRGSMEIIWNADPSDRVSSHGSLFKWQSGSWVPTTISMQRNDLCTSLYSPKEFWYDSLIKYIYEEDRVCLNQKGAVFRLKPNSNVTMNFKNIPNSVQLSGHYKIKFYIHLIDKHGKKRKDYICAELHADVIMT